MRWALSSPTRSRTLGGNLLLLHVTGRTSGRLITVPVAYRTLQDGRLLVLTNAKWRVNLRDRDEVEVTLRGVRQAAAAELVEDADEVAMVYAALIREVGRKRAARRLGIRINVEREPSHEELSDAARRDGLSLVYLGATGGLR